MKTPNVYGSEGVFLLIFDINEARDNCFQDRKPSTARFYDDLFTFA